MMNNDLDQFVVSCSSSQEIDGVLNDIKFKLSIEIRKRINEVFLNYLTAFGIEEVFRRMNGRSISQILAEFEAANVNLIESSETDGVRYELYEAPKSTKNDQK